MILNAGGGSSGHRNGSEQGAMSCRQGEEVWKLWKASIYVDVSLSDGVVEYAKTHKEIKEHELTMKELRRMACAKPEEIASWTGNVVIDLCVSRGAPRHRTVRCRWNLVFKKLDAEDAKEADQMMDQWSPIVCDGSKREREAKARLVILG